MTQEKFKNEKEIRRFLLGEMTEEERTAFEEKFIAEDSGLFDEISVTEDELIESYLREALPVAEKTSFEQNFLTTKARRQRVDFTREMLAKLAAEKEVTVKKTETVAGHNSVWNFLAGIFKTPQIAFGAAFAALLLAFGFWFFVFRGSENKPEIVQKTTPTPTATPAKIDETNQNSGNDPNAATPNKPEANKTPSNINAENPNKNQPEIKAPPPKPIVATIALFAGTLRSEGKMRTLELTKETKGANFELNLESQDYQTYRAEIVDADGGVIYRSGKINARKSRLNTFFPTAKLKKGDYFVKLYGFNSKGEEESAADFQFRVNQK